MLKKTLTPNFIFLLVCLLFVAYHLSAFRFLLPLGSAFLLHGAAMGLGALLLTFLAPNFKRRAELLVWGWAVGLGAIGLVMFFAAHLNSFGPSIALFVMVMGWGAWLALVQMDALDFKFVASALRESWLVVCLAVVLVLVLGCMTPPLFWDTNVYHVTLPMQYLMWGGAHLSPHFSFSSNPLLAELALSPVLILSFDPLHMNVAHGVTLLLLLSAVGLTAKRFICAVHWPVSLVGLLSMPVVVFVASALKSDLFTAIFTCGVIYALFALMQLKEGDENNGLVALLGVCAGMGASTRYHGMLFIGLLLATALAFPVIRNHLVKRRAALTLVMSGGVIGALFLIQNAIVFGNPVYPFLDAVIGNGEFTQRFAETQVHEKFFTDFGVQDLLRLPLVLIYEVVDGDRNELLAFYPILALLLWLPVFKKHPALKLLGVSLLVALPFWVLTSPRPRYLPLLWVFLALAGTAGFSALRERSQRWLAGGLLLCALLVGLSWNLQADEKLLNHRASYIFGHEDRETYLKTNYGPYAVYDYINKNTDTNAVVFLVGDNRAAYLERRALVSGVYVTPHHETLLTQSTDAEDLKRLFRASGASHLLISQPGLKRLTDWGWGQWSEAERVRWQNMMKLLGKPLYAAKGWLLFSL